MAVLGRFGLLVLALAAVATAATAAPVRGREAAAQPPRAAAPAKPPSGAPEMRIAAVVNDEVISVFDLVSRIRMVMMSSNIPDTPENRQRLASQVLRAMIDEKLELQEARAQSVTASDKEVNAALEQIEKQNNLKSGQLNELLRARGIDRGALLDQLTASIVWAKLVRRMASQTTEISDDEVDQALQRAKEHAKEPESRVAEIFLSVDNPSQDAEVRGLAERLSQQMRQGARFSALAQQFSRSATAAVGGDMGWLRADQLQPDLAKVVAQLRPGELSAPIRAGGGYYLLLVLDRRNGGAGSGGEQEAVYDIVQVVFPISAKAGEQARRAAIAEAEGVREAAKNCPSLLKIGKEKAPQLSSEGKLRSANISPQMRDLVNKLGIGKASQPIVQKNGVGVIMVCGKSNGGGPVTRETVTESLLRQRFDAVARRYLRDLRSKAYVDVRV